MQLQQLGLPGYGYSPSSSGAGSAAAGGTSSASGGATGSANGIAAPTLSPVSSVTALADVRESESLNFQLADGTEVTIRMRAHATALGASQTQSDGTTSSMAALMASGQLQVEVKGNLSNDDLNAINNVVSQVDSLATQFFSGDAQGAFAAAASLNMDPTQIASFSLKLSYSSELYQQATTNAAAAGASTTPATSTASGSTSASPAASDTSSSTSSAGSSGTVSSTSGTSSATPSASPQQIIINFVQQAMAKLRASSSGSNDRGSLHWKVKLLAQALPAYAQAQAAAGASAQAGDTSGATAPVTGSSAPAAGTSAAASPSTSTGTSAAATSSSAVPASATTGSQTTAPAQSVAAQQPAMGVTVLQAARLAADTLNRLAEQ